jgi:aspartyl-tRNA(Asn)/glutamyl-tRNA(Gln) amidotransferase subunit B
MLIKSSLTYLGICDGNMEEGSLRCDANVSVMLRGSKTFGQKTEVKNMNSFRNVQRALEAEIVRQIELIEAGGKVQHQTLLFDANKGLTRPMRTKEEAHDYRYFPEPDLLPVTILEKFTTEVRAELPELQRTRRDRLVSEYQIPKYDASVLTAEKEVADYYEQALSSLSKATPESAKTASNFVMGDVMRTMTEKKQSIREMGLSAAHLAELVELIVDKTISNKIAKDLFGRLLNSDKSPRVLVNELGLVQVTDTEAIREAVKRVIAANPDNLSKYKGGKATLFGFFVGQTIKASGGKANPQVVNDIVKEELERA